MRMPGPGKPTMHVLFRRFIPRTGHVTASAIVPPNTNQNFHHFDVNDLPSFFKPTLKLLPYGYLGTNRDTGTIADAGLDYRYAFKPNLDIVGTVNPDFRNVENAILSLDFSYFERLVAESRPFFLEGTSNFTTSVDTPIFITQRIKHFDTGLKVIGKINPTTNIGFLNTEDFGNESNTVLNLKHAVNNDTQLTFAGAERDRPGYRNTALYGGYSAVHGEWGGFFQASATDDTVSGRGNRINTGVNYNGKGLFGLVEYLQISPDFNPALGFVRLPDVKGIDAWIDRVQSPTKGNIQRIETGASVTAWHTFNFKHLALADYC